MHQDLVGDREEISTVRVTVNASIQSVSGRESVRLLAIGSRRGVLALIHNLHVKGFAEAGAWSRLLPGPNPNQVMSILTWYVSLD
jgi:hypothetical protein